MPTAERIQELIERLERVAYSIAVVNDALLQLVTEAARLAEQTPHEGA